MEKRIPLDDYFMEIAHIISKRSTCLRHKVGAIITKDKQIITTGYNGAARGMPHCLDVGCLRDEKNIPSGERHEICRAVHAEQNAIIQAARQGASIKGGTLYCTINPCIICSKMIVNAGITRVVYEEEYSGEQKGIKFLEDAGVKVENYETDRMDRYTTEKF